MKRKVLAGLLILTMTFFTVGCSSYDTVKKYEAVGIITDTYSRWRGVAGKGGSRKYYTVIELEGVEYTISGSSTYRWAEDREGQPVNLNIDEYLKDGAIIRKEINIDYYKQEVAG